MDFRKKGRERNRDLEANYREVQLNPEDYMGSLGVFRYRNAS